MQKFYDINVDNDAPKNIDDIDTAKIAIASCGSFVTNKESDIIGTYDLDMGIAIIISDVEDNYVLGHFLDNFNINIYAMLDSLNTKSHLTLMVIPGALATTQSVNDVLVFLRGMPNMMLYQFETNIVNLGNYIEDDKIDFAFDTETKEFLKPNYVKIQESGRV